MNKTIKKVLIGLLILLVLIQFIRIDKTKPETDPSKDFLTLLQPPEDIASIISTTCYDCHSHETTYPWYSNIAPISFWLKGHVNEGRHHLNFSEWATYTNKRAHHKLEECYEEVEEGHMPLPSYTWTHKEARFSQQQRESVANWFKGKMPKYENFEE